MARDNFGYCGKCHAPITGSYKVVNGKRICQKCLQEEKETRSKKQQVAQESKEKEGLLSFLSSYFSVPHIPEHWVSAVGIMLSKGMTGEGVKHTVRYCEWTGKHPTEENWSALVYVYYDEAQKDLKEQERVAAINSKKKLTKREVTVKIKSTTYVDTPEYNIEDL